MVDNFSNAAETTLATAIDTDDTTVEPTSADGFPDAAPFRIRIKEGSNNEICTVTAGAGTTSWTVTRASEAYGGSQTAYSFTTAAVIEHVLTAGALESIVDASNGLTDPTTSDGDMIYKSFNADVAQSGTAIAFRLDSGSFVTTGGTAYVDAIDGDDNTYWSTPNWPQGQGIFEVTLDAPMAIAAVRVKGTFPGTYKVQSSTDDSNWTDRVASTSSSDTGVLNLGGAITAQYWRIGPMDGSSPVTVNTFSLFTEALARLPIGDEGDVLSVSGTTPTWIEGNKWIEIVKSTDFSAENTGVAQADDELTFSADANSGYIVEYYIIYTASSTTADYRFQFILPTLESSAQSVGVYTIPGTGGGVTHTSSLSTGSAWPAGTGIAAGADPNFNAMLFGSFVFHTDVSGTCSYGTANGTSGSGNISTTKAGSMIRYRKLV